MYQRASQVCFRVERSTRRIRCSGCKVSIAVFLGIALLIAIGFGNSCFAKEGRKVILATFHPQKEPSAQMIARQLEDFTKRTGIEVEYKPGVSTGQVLVMIAAGTPPDVFWIGDTVLQYGLKGALEDLMPYVERDKFDLERFFPILLHAYTYGGKLYGFPNDSATAILYYNQELFDAGGIAAPDKNWDWDMFASAAQKLTIRNSDGSIKQYGFGADTYVHMIMPWFWSSGGRVLDDGRERCLINSAEAERGLDFLVTLMNKVKVMPTSAEQARKASYEGFLSGQIAMQEQGAWMCSTLMRDRAEFKWNIAPLPKGPRERTTIAFYGGFAMASNARNKKEAWELLKYFASDEGQTCLVQNGFAAVPSVRSAAMKKENYIKAFGDPKNPRLNVGLIPESLTYSRIMPEIPWNPGKIAQILGDAFGKVLNQQSSSRAALETAYRLISEALKRK